MDKCVSVHSPIVNANVKKDVVLHNDSYSLTMFYIGVRVAARLERD